jgi:hypothetical protein
VLLKHVFWVVQMNLPKLGQANGIQLVRASIPIYRQAGCGIDI